VQMALVSAAFWPKTTELTPPRPDFKGGVQAEPDPSFSPVTSSTLVVVLAYAWVEARPSRGDMPTAVVNRYRRDLKQLKGHQPGTKKVSREQGAVVDAARIQPRENERGCAGRRRDDLALVRSRKPRGSSHSSNPHVRARRILDGRKFP
jgi:hypothetical protein